MNTAVVVAKIDPQTKKEAQKAAQAIGMPLSVVIKGLLKQFIKTKTVTFSAQAEEIPNENLKKIFRQADKDLKAGKASPTFKTGEEAVAWLEKQGI